MLISFEGIMALRSIRLELQEEAGPCFPHSVLIELLILRDVCKKLDLNIFQCQEVLSEHGWAYTNRYINLPIDMAVEHHLGNSTDMVLH